MAGSIGGSWNKEIR